MEENLRLLQADINDRLNSIDDAYQQLDGLGSQATGSNQDIIIGYYLHVLYGLFENIFEQVAENFGNQIADTTQWHSQLLRRMTLDVKQIRPAVISRESYIHLNELHAQELRSYYRADLEKFLAFLEQLIQSDSSPVEE